MDVSPTAPCPPPPLLPVPGTGHHAARFPTGFQAMKLWRERPPGAGPSCHNACGLWDFEVGIIAPLGGTAPLCSTWTVTAQFPGFLAFKALICLGWLAETI
jgi:hypothetical protein